jgi:hypothetical protein
MGTTPFEDTSLASEDTGKIQAARLWLRVAMAKGARPAAEVEAEALSAGIPHATLALARRREHISSRKRGAAWFWTHE